MAANAVSADDLGLYDPSNIETILTKIGLSRYCDIFVDNMIGVNEVEQMNDEDFSKLGITSMGIRLRIKTACRDHVKAQNANLSPVVATFINLQKKRKVVQRKSPKKDTNTKLTRRIYLGWKHEIKPGVYKLIPASKGGGQQILDVHKDLDYSSLHKEVCDIFFPNGISKAQNMQIEDVTSHLASFSGSRLPTLHDEGGFTVGKYFKFVKSSPVRIYLHTQSCEVKELSASPVINNVKVDPIKVMSDTDTDNEFDTGTPSMSFKPARRRLNLKRRLKDLKPTTTMQYNLDPKPTTATQDSPNPKYTIPTGCSPDPKATGCSPDSKATGCSPDPKATGCSPDPKATGCSPDSKATGCSPDPKATGCSPDPKATGCSPDPKATGCSPDPKATGCSPNPKATGCSPDPKATIAIVDSDDEDYLRAIRASLESYESKQSSDAILRTWVGNVLRPAGNDETGHQDLLIHRRRILDSTLRAVGRLGFDFKSPFRVTFVGEMGDDLGGPRREFLSFLMKELDRSIFDGPATKRRFLHSVQKLEKRLFYNAAVFVGWSILHGGPGIPVLSESVYKLLVGQEVEHFLLEDVDLEVQEKVTMINDGTEEDIITMNDWLIDLGIGPFIIPVTSVKRNEVAQQVLRSHIHFRVHAEMAQFKEGLQFIGLFDIMAKNPEQLSFLFVPQNDTLTSRKLRSLYTVNLSDRGHNHRTSEEDTLYAFECAIQECEGDASQISISDVLSFWTGSDSIPPMGFDKKLEIVFVANNALENKLPVAHNCGMTLELPRGITDPEKMLNFLTIAVKWGGQFHLA